MTSACEPDQAISVDEIGIATARHGGLVLRTAFQLVYRPDGDRLRAVAAESFLRPFRDGQRLPARAFFDTLDVGERALVEELAVALHLLNHRHLDVEGLDHIVALGPACAARPDMAARLAGHLAALPQEADTDAWVLVCGVRAQAGTAMPVPSETADGLRTLGVRLALGGAPGEQPPLDAIRRLAPDIVRMDGDWFRRVVSSEGALRLLPGLVAGFKAQGALVLVEGIETRDQLAAALDAGADLLQGFLLSCPQLAGAAVEAATLPLSGLLAAKAPVIRLFGGGR